MKITLEHVKRGAGAALALAGGAYAVAYLSPDLMTASFVQRFHAGLVLLLAVALVLSVLRSMASGASYGIEARLVSGPAFFAWTTYNLFWHTPTANPATAAILLVVAAGLCALLLFEALRYQAENRSA